jgi:hypothetical protein
VSSFKEFKDFNGYIFAQINIHVATFYQTGKIENHKAHIAKLVNKLSEGKEKEKEKMKEKLPEKILTDMKSRIDTAIDLYNILLTMEKDLRSKFPTQL